MSASPGMLAFKLTYELCPIILTGGVAAAVPGGMLPIISLTSAASFVSGLLGGASLTPDNTFASFVPLPGATLVDNAIGNYPFANQAVAANSIITQPLRISLLMRCPATATNKYVDKLAVITALVATLAQHNVSGGTYTVATPSYIYDNAIMVGMRDVSGGGGGKQVQYDWQFDFVKPLVSLASAQQAQNAMMSKVTAGVQTDGATSGLGLTTGQPPTLATPAVAPSASGTGAAGVAGNPFTLSPFAPSTPLAGP